jgi:hypothetical protein
MTVRTWFTLSALAIVALFAASAYFFLFRTIPVPEIVAGVGDIRIEGAMRETCWPQRGELECETGDEEVAEVEIPPSGEMRFVVLFPTQPDDGTIRITDERGLSVLETEWTREVSYTLESGTYNLEVAASYPEEASLLYAFRLIVS